MNRQVETWYDYLLQQMIAESYLEGINNFSPSIELQERLENGNNRQVTNEQPSGFTRFTRWQAVDVLNRFFIVHQWSDNPNRTGNLLPGMPGYIELNGEQILANSGLSATLILNIDPNSDDEGQYTLSIRSTEYPEVRDGGDRDRDLWGTDRTSIGFNGIALAQLDALDRYVQWLQRTPDHLPPGTKFNITGYSLGGHLATLFTELHPELVLHTYTFNGAGRGEWSQTIGGLSEVLEFYRNVLVNPGVAIAYSGLPDLAAKFAAALLDSTIDPVSLYGSARYEWALAATSVRFGLYGTGFFLPLTDPDRTGLTNGASELITQIYGRAENGDGEYVSNSGVHGPATEVFIEDQPNVQGWIPGWEEFGFGNTHSLTLLGDSLAVMRLFEKLDPDVTIEALGEIFAVASNQSASANLGIGAQAEGDSLERIVQALGRLVGAQLLKMDVNREATGFADIGNRDAFHQNVSTILGLMPDSGYRIKSLSEMTRDELVKAAKGPEGLSYRYALMSLNTFVAEGAAGALYDRYRIGGSEAGALDYDEQGRGEVSETWIVDRAELLLWKMRVNKADNQDENGTIYLGTGVPLILEDATSEFRLNAFQSAWGGDDMPLLPTFRQVLFGRDDNAEVEPLVGGQGVDHLYGGRGNDRLSAGQGDDYLEGGSGDDVLEGGGGNDELLGGKGFDRYIFSTGDGHDVVLDSDGIGRVEIDGQVISGGVRVGNGSFSDGVHSYQLVGNGADRTLHVDGVMEIKGFRDGDLGIVLIDGATWQSPTNFATVRNGRQENGDIVSYGNWSGSTGDDLLAEFRLAFGSWGDDVMSMAPNTSIGLIAGGPGNDLLTASFSGDPQNEYPPNKEFGLVGGTGNDLVMGSDGKDQLFGDIFQLAVNVDASWSTSLDVQVDYARFDAALDDESVEIQHDRRFGIGSSESWTISEASSVSEAFRYGIGMDSSDSPLPEYDDYIEAGGGDDVIWAGNGSDTVYGGPGNDTIVGDSYAYQLTLWGPDAGSNSWEAFYAKFGGYLPLDLLGAPGNDWLEGGDGDDNIEGGNGNDVLIGGAGNDRLDSAEYSKHVAGMNYLDGGAGNDSLWSRNLSSGGKDHLVGGVGDDTYNVWSNSGDDWPQGAVEIEDSDGSDSFSISVRAGLHVSIRDTDPTGQDQDNLTINARIAPVDLSQGWLVKRIGEDLVVEFGPGALASLVIEDWFGPGGHRIEMINVADRFLTGNDHYRHWTADQFEALAQLEYVPHLSGEEGDDELTGWADDDILTGLGGNDVLAGYGGEDYLKGSAGNDVLEGGEGDDLLEGGSGDDTYVYMLGDGIDRIIDPSGSGELNTLKFGPGIDPESVTLGLGSLVIKLGDGGQIHLESFDRQDPFSIRDIDRFLFADGTVWTYQELLERGIRIDGTAGDDVIVGTASVDVIAAGGGLDNIDGKAGNDRLLGGTGSDLYRFGRQSGSDVILDEGVAGEIDAVSLEAGIRPQDLALVLDGNDLLLRIIGTESELKIERWSQAASQIEEVRFADGGVWGLEDILLAMSGRNEAPVLSEPLPDSMVFEDVGSMIFVNRELFMDSDGDTLTFSASLSDGTALPEWLTFDPVTVSFLVMPQNEHVGEWAVTVTATDPGGEAAFGQFSLEIVNTNDAPSAVEDSYSMMEDGILIVETAMLTGNDTDPDPSGDVLQVVGVEGASGGVAILRADGSVVFTPDPDFSGAASYRYTVSDQKGGIGSAAVQIAIAPVNDAPRLVNPLSDVVVQEGIRFDYRLPMQAYMEVDEGDAISLSARLASGSGLPPWLTFDAMTGLFSGTPVDGSSGSLEIVVFATDLHEGEATDTFAMTINPPPGRSVIGTSRADVLVGGSGNDVIDGLAGADRMTGLKGNDTYRVDHAQDLVIEGPGEGIDVVLSSVNYLLGANVENLTLTGAGSINGTGNVVDNVIVGNKAANALRGEAGNDLLRGGDGADYLYGGTGDDEIHGETGADYLYGDDDKDSLYGEDGADYLYGGKQDDLLHGGAGADYLLGEDGADSLDGGMGADYLYGGSGNDYLLGGEDADYLMGDEGNDLLVAGSGSDYLYAGQGIDMLQAGEGADYLTAVDGKALLDAGGGSDYLTGGNGAQLLAGGRGNDYLTAGTGSDVIAFNKGDGSDIVRPSTGMDDAVSLGGGIRYSDLTFSRSGTDLVLATGGTDKLTLASWYAGSANKSVGQLQIIVEAMPEFTIGGANPLLDNRTEIFDFSRLAAAFDSAGQLNGWALTNALLDAHLFGSDTSAIGGDLAFQYGMNGSFSGVGLVVAQDTLGAGVFGANPQTLHSLNEIQQGVTRLS